MTAAGAATGGRATAKRFLPIARSAQSEIRAGWLTFGDNRCPPRTARPCGTLVKIRLSSPSCGTLLDGVSLVVATMLVYQKCAMIRVWLGICSILVLAISLFASCFIDVVYDVLLCSFFMLTESFA